MTHKSLQARMTEQGATELEIARAVISEKDRYIAALESRIDSLAKPSIRIGNYRICYSRKGMIWIEHESGEGMETSEDALAKCIDEFYQENF